VNHSYGLQLALAWDQPASIGTRIPAASGNVTGFKTLAMGAAVNFFDPRNPSRGTDAIWNPGLTTQNFVIELTDKNGKVGSVAAASPRYGTALHQTTGATTTRVHIVLNEIRVPLSDFAAQGLDLANVRKLELQFGGPGMPASGSIQLSDVRFQEAAGGPTVLTDKLADVAPAALPAPAATPRERAEVAAAPVGRAEDAGAPATASAPCASATRVRAMKIAKRKLTISGTSCTATVKVTIAKATSRKALQVKVKSARWTASAKLTKGKYRLTVGTTTRAVTVR
jgi:hypothetical protein